MRGLAPTALAIAAAAAPALAQTELDQRLSASPSGVVAIENAAGSVQVRGWERAEVEVTGELGRGAEPLAVNGLERVVTIRVVLPEGCRRCEGTDLVVRVPRGSRLEVEAVSADVDVRDVEGAVTVASVSGGTSVTGRPAGVSVKSVSGGIEVRAASGPVRAVAISGDVAVRGVSGEVEASSVSGEVLLSGGAVTRADLDTTSGSVRFEGGLAPAGTLQAASVSGDVELLLPAEVSARFEVSTFSGEIENQLGPAARRAGDESAEKELTFVTGAGRAHVQARSFSGTVRLLRRR